MVIAEEFFSHGRLNENSRDCAILVQEFGVRRVDDMVSNQGFFTKHLGEIGGCVFAEKLEIIVRALIRLLLELENACSRDIVRGIKFRDDSDECLLRPRGEVNLLLTHLVDGNIVFEVFGHHRGELILHCPRDSELVNEQHVE